MRSLDRLVCFDCVGSCVWVSTVKFQLELAVEEGYQAGVGRRFWEFVVRWKNFERRNDVLPIHAFATLRTRLSNRWDHLSKSCINHVYSPPCVATFVARTPPPLQLFLHRFCAQLLLPVDSTTASRQPRLPTPPESTFHELARIQTLWMDEGSRMDLCSARLRFTFRNVSAQHTKGLGRCFLDRRLPGICSRCCGNWTSRRACVFEISALLYAPLTGHPPSFFAPLVSRRFPYPSSLHYTHTRTTPLPPRCSDWARRGTRCLLHLAGAT
ncbi:hypothetical protein SCHPADRAFT_759387 [Schizopora paradoxa]|uniref:Uncharacterized protein n=1 Tax=Schizopora paradoxa TaxID=27342 RepID=A0A0H2RH24_9AGAM|nr:hypothetical protein SCHPADRAFT_759387 [Schizopora paradoxa]